jgi:cytochrome c-type biogenesis protein
MAIGSLALAFAAGMLSILSPCVLPILPIVFSAAATEQRLGPVALAIGLAASFVAIGIFVATIGFAIGLDVDLFRTVAAVLMVAIGIVLLAPRLAARIAVAGVRIASWADSRRAGLRANGLAGQFGVGVVLGAAWSPCVGPTLGAASLLASQGRDLGQVAIIMFTFGLGAALPLLAVGLASREAIARWRHHLASAGAATKAGLALTLIAAGILVLSGLDRSVETALVAATPQWLTDLTTRY